MMKDELSWIHYGIQEDPDLISGSDTGFGLDKILNLNPTKMSGSPGPGFPRIWLLGFLLSCVTLKLNGFGFRAPASC